ncbi:hypothetical protein WJX82_000026 [Trebouxia sp. C0006]
MTAQPSVSTPTDGVHHQQCSPASRWQAKGMDNFPDALSERNVPLRLLLAMGFSAFFHHSFTFTARLDCTRMPF